MEIMTVSDVSKQFNISTRMLRYYEKTGLIASTRIENYSYRVYDANAVKRLQQILVLRKLRIPVKQIGVILDDEEQIQTLEIVQKNLSELNEEIVALTTIQDILKTLVSKLDEGIRRKIRLDLLEDTELIDIVHVLNSPKTNLKEERSMDELVKASKVLESKMEVRIVYLPPATVASCQYIRDNPENYVGEKVYAFIKESNLLKIKPDLRAYGFNNPSPQEGQKDYGYEFWVTIPEDMEVPEPLIKKQFAGGLYAAHCIKHGDFFEWEGFINLLKESEEYDIDWREPEGMGGCLEEEINIYTNMLEGLNTAGQLDLLIPIKRKG
ncbi:effector binding domain-containing protein [Anaerosporobacter sp.]|uniref:effector binding domain-containing protein n=1 Tax=Anaerosporobacter sp. TaxID=1872529 RepID=UPI00286F14C9|nr:effector binding domain-containing protein [Anaerosporobacter sp.]